VADDFLIGCLYEVPILVQDGAGACLGGVERLLVRLVDVLLMSLCGIEVKGRGEDQGREGAATFTSFFNARAASTLASFWPTVSSLLAPVNAPLEMPASLEMTAGTCFPASCALASICRQARVRARGEGRGARGEGRGCLLGIAECLLEGRVALLHFLDVIPIRRFDGVKVVTLGVPTPAEA
jgi:hypothetical protein